MTLQLAIAFGFLCLVQVFAADDYGRSCRCINDESSRHFGFFLCPSRTMAQENIRELPEKECANVSVAFLDNNALTTYPVVLRDRRFKMINLSDNKLKFLPQSNLLSTKVKYLDLSRNIISRSSDELRNVTTLKTLLLAGNGLSSFDFLPDPCGLEELDMSRNYISGIDSSLTRCTALTVLNLGKNRITSLSREAFLGLRFLQTLQLSHNPLTVVSNEAFVGLSYLEGLSLKYTKVSHIRQEIFTGLQRLEYLDISGNKLWELPSNVFREMPNVETLVLDGNDLSTLPDRLLSDLTKLRYVFMRANSFTSLPWSVAADDRRSPLVVDLEGNPLRASSLRAALLLSELRAHADAADCSCRLLSWRQVTLRVCVAGTCSRDWMEALATATPGAQHQISSEIDENFVL